MRTGSHFSRISLGRKQEIANGHSKTEFWVSEGFPTYLLFQLSTLSKLIRTVVATTITVKILKFGTPQTIAIIVLKLVKSDVTLH